MSAIANLLLVTDDEKSRQPLDLLLEQSGFNVRSVPSAQAAVAMFDSALPELVVLDLSGNAASAHDACARLKADPRLRDVPQIVLSHGIDAPLPAFTTGATDYLSAPFAPADLVARLRGHLERHRAQRELERQVEKASQELARSESRNRVLFDDSPLALIVYDPESWRILQVNASCARIFGYPAEHWVGQSPGFAIASEQRETLRTLAGELRADSARASPTSRLRFLHRDGYWLETDGVVQRFELGDCDAQILILQDSSERRNAEENLRLIATEQRKQFELSVNYDALTGLPNRTLLDERIREGFVQARRTGCSMMVCYLDIDGFGEINATYGEQVTDHLLINTAECLRRCLRGGDTLVRIGSDEFALLVTGLKSDDEANGFLSDLQDRLAEPFISDTATVTLSASVGATIYPHDNADAGSLLRHALQAMLLAKQGGPGLYRRFDPESDRRVRAKRENIENIRGALARREFVLFYQPKVDLKQMRVVGAEALIRWRHPERGLLPPGAFLPDIEDDGVMIDLGYWVIGEALAQMDRWRAQGLKLAVSVNISAQHLVAPDFIDSLRLLLAEHPGSAAGMLEIEVLETSGLEDIDRVERLIVACRELGIGFSLDDFGTGYSSLTYLRRLSADTLKIDQSFVSKMLDDPADKAIISGVIGLAAAFERKVIAEGVETLAHAKALLALGCVLAQGYGIARPMAAQDLPEWVANWPDATWRAITN